MRTKFTRQLVEVGSALLLMGMVTACSASPAPQSADVTPTASPSSAPTLPAMELTVASGLSTDELADLLVERFEQWDNAGATPELFTQSIQQNVSYNELLPLVASEYGESFADAIYVEEWRDIPVLSQNVEARAERNLAVLGNYVRTAFDTEGPEVEAYYLETEVLEASEESGPSGERIMTITVRQSDNREANQVTTTELRDAEYVITTVEEGGTVKISDIEIDIL